MARVFVYRFEMFDEESRSWLRAPHYGTAGHIAGVGGAPNFASKIAVDEDDLVDEGLYQRAKVR